MPTFPLNRARPTTSVDWLSSSLYVLRLIVLCCTPFDKHPRYIFSLDALQSFEVIHKALQNQEKCSRKISSFAVCARIELQRLRPGTKEECIGMSELPRALKEYRFSEAVSRFIPFTIDVQSGRFP